MSLNIRFDHFLFPIKTSGTDENVTVAGPAHIHHWTNCTDRLSRALPTILAAAPCALPPEQRAIDTSGAKAGWHHPQKRDPYGPVNKKETDMPNSAPITREDCAARDESDPLASLRASFELPEGVIYLDGNSLGALPHGVMDRLHRAVTDEWGTQLIRAWNSADWYPAPQRTGNTIARLIGAEKGEVIVCDATSVNLFKVLISALRMRPDRKVIVSERGNFPTDVYMAAGAAELLHCELRCVEPDEIEAAIAEAGSDLALVQLTHVNYKTGRVYDMETITRQAQDLGGMAIWDLAHSAGALPVDLNGCNVDFAVGCGYKYLNGGPGAPAFVFVPERHIGSVRQPLPGWHGHARPFDFDHEYEPAPGIERMLTGTAPQLGLIALESALAVFDGVDMQAVRRKNQALGDLFIALVDQELSDFGFAIACPREAAQRGSQVSLSHPEGYAIVQALIARGVIGDFRAPDILRFGLAAPYIGFRDIWDSIAHLAQIMRDGEWDRPEFRTRQAVT